VNCTKLVWTWRYRYGTRKRRELSPTEDGNEKGGEEDEEEIEELRIKRKMQTKGAVLVYK